VPLQLPCPQRFKPVEMRELESPTNVRCPRCGASMWQDMTLEPDPDLPRVDGFPA
jgi:hypothetical protein